MTAVADKIADCLSEHGFECAYADMGGADRCACACGEPSPTCQCDGMYGDIQEPCEEWHRVHQAQMIEQALGVTETVEWEPLTGQKRRIAHLSRMYVGPWTPEKGTD